MNFETYITQIVANLTTRLNQIVENARKITELPWQSILRPGSEMQVSNPEGVSQKITVQQILDAALSFRQNQLINATVSVLGNDVTVDAGAKWVINNINYELASDYVVNVPYAELGYTRNDILYADEFNQIHIQTGPETEGVSPTPNTPINTVLVTVINVTDSTVGYTPPIIGDDFEVKINKQDSLVSDGTGTKYPTVDAVNDGLDLKLDITDYNDRFKGVYVTEAALNIAWPTANAGDYAQVNEVGSTDVVNFNWDAEENIWVEGGSGGSGAVNTDALPEGSTNLYWTTARGLALALTGLSASSGTFTSTDTLIFAFGKIKYLIDNIASIYQVILTDVNFGAFLNGLTSKTTPLDADGFSIIDTADSNKAKKLSFTNLKAFLKTYFDTIYADLTTAQTFQTGVKTFRDGILGLRNGANTFTSFFTNTNTASRTYTLQDSSGTIAHLSDLDVNEVSKTASFTVALVDAGKTYVINSAGAVVVTFPTAMTAGKWWEFVSIGTGAVSFVAGASATLVSPDSRLKLRTQYSQARIIARASNQGALGGDIVL